MGRVATAKSKRGTSARRFADEPQDDGLGIGRWAIEPQKQPLLRQNQVQERRYSENEKYGKSAAD